MLTGMTTTIINGACGIGINARHRTVAEVHSLNQCSKCKRVNYGYSYG